MSSNSDIVKFSATLWMERKTTMKNQKCYVGMTIVAAIVMLVFQLYLLIKLNGQNDSMLFCGDVIGMIGDNDDSDNQLFKADAVDSFSTRWMKIQNDTINTFWDELYLMKPPPKPAKPNPFPECGKPVKGPFDPGCYGFSQCWYYSPFYRKWFNDCTGKFQKYQPDSGKAPDEDPDIDQLDLFDKQQKQLNLMILSKKLEFIQALASQWKVSDINEKKCTAAESTTNDDDVVRAQNIFPIMWDIYQKDTSVDKDQAVFDEKEISAQLLKVWGVNSQSSKWNCPQEWRDEKGKCNFTWNCSISEWNSFCDDGMKFATTIESDLKPAWLAGLIILGVTVTADIYEHLVVIRQVPLFFKFLLIIQCIIAANISVVNASMTAAQGTAVDILMNSMGLLVLNDMDNIIATLFIAYRDKKEMDDNDLLADGIEYQDRVHAKWLSSGHILQVIFYGLWFTSVFTFADPETALHNMIVWNPYSIVLFPIIEIIWYLICFHEKAESLRCKIFFNPPVDDIEMDKESELQTGRPKNANDPEIADQDTGRNVAEEIELSKDKQS